MRTPLLDQHESPPVCLIVLVLCLCDNRAMTITLIATTVMGLESVLAKEIRDLGYEKVSVFDNKVEFEGELKDICRANLWLRSAGRIYVKIGTFKATTFDELFDQTKALPWSDWIGKTDAFPVADVSSRKSELYAKSTCQSIVKKAIVTHLQAAYGSERLPETGATCPVRIQIDKDSVTLSIDSTGEGLHKRGYRAHMDRAPLRETLAAGLLLLSRWRPDRDVLMDPFCGSGTIVIEAGLIAKNIAPGLNRSFNAESWSCVDTALWAEARQEAKDLMTPDQDCRIFGSDNEPRALSIATKNIALAGLSESVFVQNRSLSDISSRFDRGKLVTNPPYGQRLDELHDVEALYKEMGSVFRASFADWSYYILTAHEGFERFFGKRSTKHRKLYNGGMKCYFYQYFAPK